MITVSVYRCIGRLYLATKSIKRTFVGCKNIVVEIIMSFTFFYYFEGKTCVISFYSFFNCILMRFCKIYFDLGQDF